MTQDTRPKPAREPIHRRRRVIVGTLPSAERETILDEMYALWSEHFVGQTRDQLRARRIFDDTRLQLLYGASGQLAGYLDFTTRSRSASDACSSSRAPS